MTTRPARPIKLFGHPLSGHVHRVELLLSLLGLPYERIDVDLRKGEHKHAEFLKKNPFGQLPVIEDDELTLFDSNAILTYLALKYDTGTWLPRDALGAAQVQQWFSWAAGPIYAGPCAARLVTVFGADLDLDRAKGIAVNFFSVIEGLLHNRRFALGEQPTLADVAGYSYISKAPEGGISLAPYSNIRVWLQHVAALPGFVPFQETKAGLLAVAD